MKSTPFKILALALTIGVTSRLSAQTGTCKAADAFSNHVVASLQLLMQSDHSAERTAIGLPQVNASEVVLVSDAAVCTAARLAMDSIGHALNPAAPAPPPDARELYVVQVGSTYCVFNPFIASNNHLAFLFYFSSGWQFVSGRAL